MKRLGMTIDMEFGIDIRRIYIDMIFIGVGLLQLFNYVII
jgi:hypothetical protein